MKTLPAFSSIRTTAAYEDVLEALYLRVKRKVEEIVIPPIQVLSVTGRKTPSEKPYQDAIAALYGIGYTLKMGLKFGKLPAPAGYFDYGVGALGTLWWSAGKSFDISNAKTLRWQAYLIVPAFVKSALVDEARGQAKAKHPDVPYDIAGLATLEEGRSVQVLHVGPYDRERPTIDALHAYMAEHGLVAAGKHHEIYMSDPRRTAPQKLKTVIRIPVKAGR